MGLIADILKEIPSAARYKAELEARRIGVRSLIVAFKTLAVSPSAIPVKARSHWAPVSRLGTLRCQTYENGLRVSRTGRGTP